MAILVAGKLTIKPGHRDDFVRRSQEYVSQARTHPSCGDFSVSPDPLDASRVNIFEKWDSATAMQDFRNSGPESDIFSLVESFEIQEYEVET